MNSIKKRKRPTVQLTSLLDLLFIMIFISLLQSKEIPSKAEVIAPPAKSSTNKKISKKNVSQAPVRISIGATFRFYPTAQNPALPKGSFSMLGTFDRNSRKLSLGGVTWIDRPENYDMVPLTGEISPSGDLFTGRIEFIGCEQFTLKRTSPGREGIKGTWQGSYTCSQGETGLTLEIE